VNDIAPWQHQLLWWLDVTMQIVVFAVVVALTAYLLIWRRK